MTFQAPHLLLALLLLPLLAWLYWRVVWREAREGYALLPGLEPLRQGSRKDLNPRRYLPLALYGLALFLGLLALARPQAMIPLPDESAGIVLTIDVSGSMRATDIAPSRMEAAKAAARDFVERLPEGIKVGLVSFAGYAILNSPLTTDHAEVLEQISYLERRPNTAIGEGLMESVRAFPLGEDGKVVGSATVILLSDGQNRTGVEPEEAAREATKLGVVVHTIGVGRAGGFDPSIPFAGFDEAELRGIADVTGGRYFAVGSAERLLEVYRELQRQTVWKPQRTEVTAVFSLLAGMLVASSLLLANWKRRVI
ncbi:vWA domain-containing protein [Calidithermus roseus]|uniref:VWFA-related Acidobacterial domain protein n=1 Tax=Calidithermus roseus TaxID=1644118 RepID=A0A399F0J0_9DEIN|nr:VWA domain-containing protein [Calidithermus roseus]RIH89325.1 VWFA-related Acidobacterial domain protein [Calidithermus roseus]